MSPQYIEIKLIKMSKSKYNNDHRRRQNETTFEKFRKISFAWTIHNLVHTICTKKNKWSNKKIFIDKRTRQHKTIHNFDN